MQRGLRGQPLCLEQGAALPAPACPCAFTRPLSSGTDGALLPHRFNKPVCEKPFGGRGALSAPRCSGHPAWGLLRTAAPSSLRRGGPSRPARALPARLCPPPPCRRGSAAAAASPRARSAGDVPAGPSPPARRAGAASRALPARPRSFPPTPFPVAAPPPEAPPGGGGRRGGGGGMATGRGAH